VLGKGYIDTTQRGLAAHDSAKAPRIFLYLKLISSLLKLKGLFIGSKQALEALGNLENLDFNLLVKLRTNPCTNRNRIRLDLPPLLRDDFGVAGA
jgi:hypothetical protein